MTVKLSGPSGRLTPSDLDQYKQGGFPNDYPDNMRVFYSPVDDVHGAILAVLKSARESLAVAVYGFDDEEFADVLKSKLEDEHVAVTLTLDSSQAGGTHERALLARVNYPKSIIAVGRSEKSAIMHQKIVIVDGLITVKGSTNWSDGGEAKQDNECTIVFDRTEAHLARCRIDAIHANMIAKQHN
jgi:phosphatidylserine/phosphatidylglycerophosphate/cardiolipin synthase-like enzyme